MVKVMRMSKTQAVAAKPRLFITATFRGSENRGEIEGLCEITRQAGFNDFCFIRDVENYQKIFTDPAELMKRALDEIKKSDYLLIDMTRKPTGRAFEAGMAFALGVKVIIIARKGTVLKDTALGIASAIIEYDDLEKIRTPLACLAGVDGKSLSPLS